MAGERCGLGTDQAVRVLVRDRVVPARVAGQVAYHLLVQAGAVHAPWQVTTLVSCLPVLVLGMGAALAHMSPADMSADRSGAAEMVRERAVLAELDLGADHADRMVLSAADQDQGQSSELSGDQERLAEVWSVASNLAASGRRVSRRALRAAGVRGSNAELGTMARVLSASGCPESSAVASGGKS